MSKSKYQISNEILSPNLIILSLSHLFEIGNLDFDILIENEFNI